MMSLTDYILWIGYRLLKVDWWYQVQVESNQVSDL